RAMGSLCPLRHSREPIGRTARPVRLNWSSLLIELRLASCAVPHRLDNRVVARSHDTPAWRVFGAALGAFGIAVQLLVSAFLIGQMAAAANQAGLTQADLAVICTHDAAATADDNAPLPVPHQHGQCAACGCPQWAKVLGPLPTPPVFLVLRPHSQTLREYAGLAPTELAFSSPYAPPPPPSSA